MDIQTLLGYIAGIIGLVAFIPYFISIIKGETEPNITTWLVLFVADWLVVYTYHDAGANNTVPMTWGYAIGVTIVLVASFSKGVIQQPSKIEWMILIVALLSLASVSVAYQPDLIVALMVFALTIAAIPTFKKTFNDPGSEDILSWSIWGVGAIINFFSLEGLFSDQEISFIVIAHPIYVIYFDVGMVLLLFWKKSKPKKSC